MAIDIKTIVGKDALTGLAKANTELKESNTLIKEQIKLLDTLNKEYSETKNATQLKAKLNKQEQTNIKIKKQQETSTKKLTSLEKERIRVQQQTKKVFSQTLSLEEKGTKTLIKGQERLKIARKKAREEAQKSLGVSKKSNGLFRSMAKSMIAVGVAAIGIRTVFNVFKNGLKTIANFEEAMSKVKAVSGALPKEFKQLTSNAKLLGSTTSKTATEVSGLQLEFSKLGFSTTEILAATEATISLSIAAGSDLAESAVVAASTIRGFGLNASETQRVVDVMAKSFSSSALDLEKFKTSMAAVAPVAKANGKDIEFVTARLSVLSDAGLDASTSGTSLRNMFLELSKRGLTWEQGLAKINNSTNKNVTALELFGKRGATAALILADNITKAQGLEKAYDGAAGSAEEMARIMEDNLIGDTKKLSSAWEGFILGLNKGDGTITVVFRGLVKWLTSVVNMFNMANKSYKDLIEEAKNNQLSDFIEGDAKEVAFLTEKLGDYNKAVKLVLASLKQQELNWLTKEEREELEARIFALNALIDKQEKHTEVIAENTDATDENTDSVTKNTKAREKNISTIRTSLSFHEKNHERVKKLEESNTKTLTDELLKRYEANKKYLEDIANDDDKAADYKKAAIEYATSEISNISGLLFDYNQSLMDKELDALQVNYAAQINAAEGNTEKQELLAKELAQKQYEIQFKQAKSEKDQALVDIAISTAVGAAKALPNIALAALVTASGLLQGYLVQSQPLPTAPAYAKGTNNSASTFIAGDPLNGSSGNSRELILTKDGKMTLTPNHATLYNGMAGSTVIPNKQTEQVLKAVDMANAGVFDTQQLESKLDVLTDAVKRSKTRISVDKRGIGIGNNALAYKANTRFRN